VPGYDFTQFHVETIHGDHLCLEGDVFKDENAKAWGKIGQVHRPKILTETGMKKNKKNKKGKKKVDTYEEEYKDYEDYSMTTIIEGEEPEVLTYEMALKDSEEEKEKEIEERKQR
jgi:hypothetical protein